MRFFNVGTAVVVSALYATSASAAETKLSLKHKLLGYTSETFGKDAAKETNVNTQTLGGAWGFEVNNGDCTLYMDLGAAAGDSITYGHMVTPEVEVLVGLGLNQTSKKVGTADAAKTNAMNYSLGGTYYLTLDDASYLDLGLALKMGSSKPADTVTTDATTGVKTTVAAQTTKMQDIEIGANYNMKIWDRVEYSAGLMITSTNEKAGSADAVTGTKIGLTLAAFKYTL